MNIEDAIRIIKGLDTSNSEENIEASPISMSFSRSRSSSMHSHSCTRMTSQYFPSSSSRKDVEMVRMDSSCRW